MSYVRQSADIGLSNPENKEAKLLESVVPPVILVVDNDPTSLDLYGVILQKAGYAVFEANNLNTALMLAEQVQPQLILIDLRLPKLHGFEVCELLKASPNTCQIPVVFISAATEESVITQAYGLGAVDFILKPCRIQQLANRVSEHLTPC